MTMPASRPRILIVEDEILVAMNMEDALEDIGCDIVGPVAKLEAALDLAREAQIDAAILDVTIRGGQVFPVAEILIERGVPFVLASGYGDWALPEAMRDQHRLTKPFSMEEVKRMVKTLIGRD